MVASVKVLSNGIVRFSFPDVHRDAVLDIEFMRTLRIPDDGRNYGLPPGIATFPAVDAAGLHKLKNHHFGGVAFPMWDNEAMWIKFHSPTQYKFLVKVGAGKINAVTGRPWKDELDFAEQDFVEVPRQKWLDGFCVDKGIIRQFIASIMGAGKTVEEQVTGKAEFGGLQFIVYPVKASLHQARPPVTRRSFVPGTKGISNGYGPLLDASEGYLEAASSAYDIDEMCFAVAPESFGVSRGITASAAPKSALRSATVGSLGMGQGGKMNQEVHKTALSASSIHGEYARTFVHMVDARDWFELTGKPTIYPPFSARDYAGYGYTYVAPSPGTREYVINNFRRICQEKAPELLDVIDWYGIPDDDLYGPFGDRLTQVITTVIAPKGMGYYWNHRDQFSFPYYKRGDGVKGSPILASLKTMEGKPAAVQQVGVSPGNW